MGQISPHDVVPALRPQLVFSGPPQGLGEGLLSVTNVTSGEELRLRGFEYSLARMLDGHRTAQEVVAAAEQLGLPLTLGGLEGFVSKLASFDLVGPGSDGSGQSAYGPRARWDEATRENFRQALREGRTGHLEEASAALDELLERAPQTLEARGLRDRVEARKRSGGNGAVSFPQLFQQTERRWLEEAQAVSPAYLHGKGVVVFWLLIAVAAAVTVGAAVVPIPRVVSAPAILLPISSIQVIAPRGGMIATVPVSVGQRVKKGDVLFGYDTAATLAALDLAVVRVERERRGLELLGQPAEPEEARARVDRAEAQLEQAEELLSESRVAAGDPFAESVQLEEEAFSQALDELQRAELELESANPAQRIETLRRLENEVRQLERELEQSLVRAPQDGRVITLEVHVGDAISPGMDAARLDDSQQLRVVATVERAAEVGIEPGRPVELIGQGQTVQTTVRRVEGPYVELVIDNRAMILQPGIGRIEVQARPQPLVRLR